MQWQNSEILIEGMLQAARDRLLTIINDTELIGAAKPLSSGTDLVIVCDSDGILRGVVTKTDVEKQISTCQGATCLCPVVSVMTRDVALCRGSDRLKDMSELMKQRQAAIMHGAVVRRAPVLVPTAGSSLTCGVFMPSIMDATAPQDVYCGSHGRRDSKPWPCRRSDTNGIIR